jgi:predicted site-specific integrase-resolvase
MPPIFFNEYSARIGRIRPFGKRPLKNTEAHLRIALYARVSTADKGQDPENQLAQLREMV